jgi:TPP-dependent pyruvate/acetoin dehydrogenase alpha subunit
MKTYRWFGHYVGDPGNYRPEGELELWKADEKEPLKRFRIAAVQAQALSEAELDEMRANVAVRVNEAVEFAKNSPALPPESALDDVYEAGLL